MTHPIITDLQWRYATKRFDPKKKISSEDLDVIREALRLTATSYGLQVMRFLLIESPEIRRQLVEASNNQKQVQDASHLIVLCTRTNVEKNDVESYMQNIATTRSVELEETEGLSNYILQSVSNMTEDDIRSWNAKQAYIALGHLLQTCATLRIDSTPMEGFNPQQYDEILGLSEKGLQATLVCPIGYRHPDDPAQHRKKVRRSHDELFNTI